MNTTNGNLPDGDITIHHNEEIANLLAQITDWSSFDVFQLANTSNGKPLQLVTLHILTSLGIPQRLSLDTPHLIAFAQAIESKYDQQPYHNSTHAADVVQAVYSMMKTDQWSASLTDIELLALIIAAAVHDIGHPGVNNDFHKRTNSQAAQQYASMGSINERYHAHLALNLLEDPSLNFIAPLGQTTVEEFKNMIEELVLCTDMANHHSLVESFTIHINNHGTVLSQWPVDGRKTALKMLLHCADISNPARPLRHCTEWGTRVQEELYCQGEKEHALGLSVTPACDREQGSLCKSQAAFIKHIMRPCMLKLSPLAPSFVSMVLPYVDASLMHWRLAGGDSSNSNTMHGVGSGDFGNSVVVIHSDGVNGGDNGDISMITTTASINTTTTTTNDNKNHIDNNNNNTDNQQQHSIDDDLKERNVSTELISSIAP